MSTRAPIIKTSTIGNETWRNARPPDEAVFQRTIMMDWIDRHQLADVPDYSCESHWECVGMPQRPLTIAGRIASPRLDLVVASKTESILGTFEQYDLGAYLQTMCPEDKSDGAFHFLSIAVEGVTADIAKCKAHGQNFNTATQALHNILCSLMQMAGSCP